MILILGLIAGISAGAMVLSIFDMDRNARMRRAVQQSLRGIPDQGGWIRQFIRRMGRSDRQRKMWRSIPDFFDLLALCLSSGLNFRKAFQLSVAHLPPGILREELNESERALRIGGSMDVALRDVAARVNDPRSAGAFALILQSNQRGNPLQEVLFDQAAALRRLQMLSLEKKAQTIGIRLLFPIMIFIFPTIFLLLFGALYLSFIQNGGFF